MSLLSHKPVREALAGVLRQRHRTSKCSSCRQSFLRYSGSVSDVTRILEAVQQGDPKAADELLPLVYEDLRRLAAHRMANEASGHTLQPTALGATRPEFLFP